MLRLPLLAAALPLAFPAAGLAESINLASNVVVESTTATRPDPVVRGVDAAAGRLVRRVREIPPPADPAADASLRRNVAADCSELPEPHGRVGARYYFVAAAGTEARTTVEVVRGIRTAVGGADPEAGFDVDLAARLAAFCRIGRRERDALAAADRPERTLEVRF